MFDRCDRHYILSPFGRQRMSAHFFKYSSSWSERIKRFKTAAIIRFDLVLDAIVPRCSTSVSSVADSHLETQGSKPGIFFLKGPFYASITPPIYCIVTVKECMAE